MLTMNMRIEYPSQTYDKRMHASGRHQSHHFEKRSENVKSWAVLVMSDISWMSNDTYIMTMSSCL